MAGGSRAHSILSSLPTSDVRVDPAGPDGQATQIVVGWLGILAE